MMLITSIGTISDMADQTDLTQRILQDIQQRLIALDKKVDTLDQRVEDGFLNINVRMTSFEQKLDGISMAQTAQADRLDNLEKRLQQVERRLNLVDEPTT